MYDIFQLQIKEGWFRLILFVQKKVEYTGFSQISSRKSEITKKISFSVKFSCNLWYFPTRN